MIWKTELCHQWMSQFFDCHCDLMPDRGTLRLPPTMTHQSIYDEYLEDVKTANEESITFQHFCTIWKTDFSKVIVTEVT